MSHYPSLLSEWYRNAEVSHGSLWAGGPQLVPPDRDQVWL
jgi:hypothetical protein